jgi:hypothetical protein
MTGLTSENSLLIAAGRGSLPNPLTVRCMSWSSSNDRMYRTGVGASGPALLLGMALDMQRPDLDQVAADRCHKRAWNERGGQPEKADLVTGPSFNLATTSTYRLLASPVLADLCAGPVAPG